MKITYGDQTIIITRKTWEKYLAHGRIYSAEQRAGMMGAAAQPIA